MTYRHLVRLWVGRERSEWGRTAALMAWIALKWTGEQIDPGRLNPFSRPGEAVPAEAVEEARRIKDRIRRQCYRAVLARAIGG